MAMKVTIAIAFPLVYPRADCKTNICRTSEFPHDTRAQRQFGFFKAFAYAALKYDLKQLPTLLETLGI